MEAMNYLPILLAAVFVSVVINTLLKRFGIPTVIGYIVTGISVSALFGLHDAFASLSHLAEFGIVFLMFTIGLEFSFKELVSMRKEVLLFGGMQLLITAALLGAIALGTGESAKSAIIIGLALALSSTAIVLKSLQEKGDTHKPYGKQSVGILLFQDLAVIPILLMLSIFAASGGTVGQMLKEIALDAVAVIAILFVIGKFLLDRLLDVVTKTDTSEIFLATVLFLAVGAAELAHLFGFTYSLGAFLAGMMLSETTYKYQVEAALIPFRDLLMGLFFVTVGMQIDLSAVLGHLEQIILIAAGIMFVKFTVILLFLRYFSRLRSALKTAMALAQVGEFALAVFTLAAASNLLEPATIQILLGASVLSMVASVFIVANLGTITDRFYPEPDALNLDVDPGLNNHIVVCGYGPMGRNVVAMLGRMQMRYVILEHDITAVRLGESRGEPIYFANAANQDILHSFRIEKAASVIVAVGNARHLRLICEALNRVSADINIVVKAANKVEEQMLADLNIGHIVLQSEEMAALLVGEAVRCELRGNDR
jgi:monovalent cation:H+ antiporter-2, CPA2 family